MSARLRTRPVSKTFFNQGMGGVSAGGAAVK